MISTKYYTKKSCNSLKLSSGEPTPIPTLESRKAFVKRSPLSKELSIFSGDILVTEHMLLQRSGK